jgi:hypothetical protein
MGTRKIFIGGNWKKNMGGGGSLQVPRRVRRGRKTVKNMR